MSKREWLLVGLTQPVVSVGAVTRRLPLFGVVCLVGRALRAVLLACTCYTGTVIPLRFVAFEPRLWEMGQGSCLHSSGFQGSMDQHRRSASQRIKQPAAIDPSKLEGLVIHGRRLSGFQRPFSACNLR